MYLCECSHAFQASSWRKPTLVGISAGSLGIPGWGLPNACTQVWTRLLLSGLLCPPSSPFSCRPHTPRRSSWTRLRTGPHGPHVIQRKQLPALCPTFERDHSFSARPRLRHPATDHSGSQLPGKPHGTGLPGSREHCEALQVVLLSLSPSPSPSPLPHHCK